jgi:hypothetical protein
MGIERKLPSEMTTHEIILVNKSRLFERTDETERYWQRSPRITYSAEGTPRVRAYVLDEDAYMGYIEKSAYVGVAFLPDEIVIETYFANSVSKAHIWYSYNEQTQVATKHTETKDTEGQSILPMAPTDTESEQNAKEISWYLRVLANDLVPTYEWQHQEDVRRQGWNGSVPFTFTLPQLQ